MDMNEPRDTNRYQNLALTAIALLLGVLVLRGDGLPGVSEAAAAGPSDGPPAALNSAQQRKAILVAIEKTNDRIAKLEASLRQGIDVNVKSMPAVQIKE